MTFAVSCAPMTPCSPSRPLAPPSVPLLVHYQTSGAERDASGFLNISTRPQFAAILRAAQPGSVDPKVNPDDVFDMLLGSMLARTLIPTVASRRRPLERLVDLVVRAVEPRT